MSSHPDTLAGQEAWYAYEGPEQDVVLSSRVRLARNLANFPFPPCEKEDDAQRVQSLVFDSFSRMEHPDRFQAVGVNELELRSQQLLVERGLLPECAADKRDLNAPDADILRSYAHPLGIVVRTDGYVSCLVNGQDHVHICSFASGLDLTSPRQRCREIDAALQRTLQFAASYDFGFLTTSLRDTGSGMKLSAHMLLSGLSLAQQLRSVVDDLKSKNYGVSCSFAGNMNQGSSLGAYYKISSEQAFNGCEEDQLAEFAAAIRSVAESERKFRSEFAENKPTVLRNIVYRMFAAVKYSRFISCSEAIDMISALHTGCSAGLIEGITYSELNALLYRVRNAHVDFLNRNGGFSYERDVVQDPNLIIARLRALIMQEALESAQICA
ncbi:ATP--guanido phosphotransferase [Treponema brennaborense]|uniref:ATP:guanido phosphotransferase n=1 Tax=Treponema brennaborense (strain DSM 12168 / CIP 105900 / DD5/3) TaxID=906968 RepID=F4LJV3_TREBD|nr:ATP--guanido phosphotransferase [Treponema brennaborense]AEE16433.1 ATP:guanido phosphotransferase [Treponema brennaborense DSM 12168]